MNYLIDENDHFSAKVTSFSNISYVVGQIRTYLDENQLEMFRRTCFGIFLDIGEISFSGQLVHQLLLRQVESPALDVGESEIRLNFQFTSKRASFGIIDFALITGLDCRNLPLISSLVDSRVHRLRDLFFDGSKSITRYNLELCFERMTKQGNHSDEDVVKIALVYFVAFVLVGKERNRNINLQWLQLVDNLDTFNNYPWGTVSYERTASSLARVMANHKEKRKKRLTRKEQYSIYGFPTILQIWSYEVVPHIGNLYAAKTSNVIPRILNWSCYHTPVASEIILNVFQKSKLQVHTMLDANDLEVEQEYWLAVGTRVGERSVEELSESKVDDANQNVPDGIDDESVGGHAQKEMRTASIEHDVKSKLDSVETKVREQSSLICSLKLDFLSNMEVLYKYVEDALLNIIDCTTTNKSVEGNIMEGVEVKIVDEVGEVVEEKNDEAMIVVSPFVVDAGIHRQDVKQGIEDAKGGEDFLLTNISSMSSFTPEKLSIKDYSGLDVVNKQKHVRKVGPQIRTPFTAPSMKREKIFDVAKEISKKETPKLDLKRKWSH